MWVLSNDILYLNINSFLGTIQKCNKTYGYGVMGQIEGKWIKGAKSEDLAKERCYKLMQKCMRKYKKQLKLELDRLPERIQRVDDSIKEVNNLLMEATNGKVS